MERINTFVQTYFGNARIPIIRWEDIAEILIISFLVYQIMLWIKNTKAWALLKGIVVIVLFLVVAAYFEMGTILWIANSVIYILAIGIIIVLQPELRRALEQLGRQNFLTWILPFDSTKAEQGLFSDKTMNEIIKASFAMGKVKTGALIVVEQKLSLAEFERTGIEVDGIVTSQLLINIFEHNTPLHDGAVIVRGDRIVSATCYLPLSDNMALSKELGTRHRAGVGISEITDSLTIIVSEETGKVSVAYRGALYRALEADALREKLQAVQNKQATEEKKRRFWKGRSRE